MDRLNQLLPEHWSRSNPVDILGDASAETYREVLDRYLKDPGVDGVLAILTAQAVTSPYQTPPYS
jgi:acetyltransferase